MTAHFTLWLLRRLVIDVDYLAVTAACMVVKADDFKAVGGFDGDIQLPSMMVETYVLKVYELGRKQCVCSSG